MLNRILFNLFEKNKIENKLKTYHGYRPGSILVWCQQLNLPWKTKLRLLRELKIFNAIEIREMLRGTVNQQKGLFEDDNCYVCKFGKPGKSGDVILYEFNHTFKVLPCKVIESWEIPSLPEKSTIIFLDDLVGTGKQSVKYITQTLNLVLNPSHQAYLLSLCCTPQGQNEVQAKTNFKILSCFQLSERDQHYKDESKIFDKNEKILLREINTKISSPSDVEFDKGLLIAFYYSAPNNTMPIIWKDEFKYNDSDATKLWFALLPRNY